MVEILKKAGRHRILSIMMGCKGENPLQLIEEVGRVSYQSHKRITWESAAKFVKRLKEQGHDSVIEHSAMTVEFSDVSRGFTHELVRHRLASFCQESTRRVDKSDFRVVIPPAKNPDEKITLTLANGQKMKVSLREGLALNEQIYRQLREAGWSTEEARQFLPIGIATQIVVTANLREWRHIFKLRCAPDAHWEIRRVMVKLLKEVKQKIPVIFDDFKIDMASQSAMIIYDS